MSEVESKLTSHIAINPATVVYAWICTIIISYDIISRREVKRQEPGALCARYTIAVPCSQVVVGRAQCSSFGFLALHLRLSSRNLTKDNPPYRQTYSILSLFSLLSLLPIHNQPQLSQLHRHSFRRYSYSLPRVSLFVLSNCSF